MRKAKVALLALTVTMVFVGAQLSTTLVLAASTEKPNPVVVWSQLTSTLGAQHKVSSLFLTRYFALVQVAEWDALLLTTNHHDDQDKAQVAIVAGAASEVLTYLFPTDATQISATEASQLAGISGHSQGQINSALRIGHHVGAKVVAYAKTDGFNAVWDGVIPTGPCTWTGVNPLGPMFGQQKTFILKSGDEVQPPPPYACGSPQDLADVQAVIDAHNNLTPEQIAAVHKWADVPAPTIWNNLLNTRIASSHLSILGAAFAAVYLNVGMYDAAVSTWATKYTYWTARPFQRISGFVPVIPTPNFPSYTSGHSTVSAAASIVLAQLFPQEASFFIAQAHEAAMSRLWAGIHYPQDNNIGLVVGAQIGAKVVSDMQGPLHPFVFPRGETE